MNKKLLVLFAAVVLVAAACNSQPAAKTTPTPTPTSQTPTPTPTSTSTTVLKTASSTALGTYLIAPNSMTLYTYANDTAGVSNCTGTCATNWPPYKISMADGLVGTTGITGNIGVIARADGTMQATYNNRPLYFYAKDTQAGDAKGDKIGQVWFVVKP